MMCSLNDCEISHKENVNIWTCLPKDLIIVNLLTEKWITSTVNGMVFVKNNSMCLLVCQLHPFGVNTIGDNRLWVLSSIYPENVKKNCFNVNVFNIKTHMFRMKNRQHLWAYYWTQSFLLSTMLWNKYWTIMWHVSTCKKYHRQ